MLAQSTSGIKNIEKTPPSNLKKSLSQDSVYTILIRLPIEGGTNDIRCLDGAAAASAEKESKLPSIKMFPDDINVPKIMMTKANDELGFGTLKKSETDPFAVSTPHQQYEFNRLPLNAKIIPRKNLLTTREKQQQKAALNKKKKSQEKRQETKAAKTLSAILLSFIITWTPYNILVLMKPLTCTTCIPQELWDFFYALCYLNSTINPVCYALCNASFRRTYVRILTCKWHTRNREAMTRGVYN